MNIAFMPKPGRFGTIPVPLTSSPLNTGTLAAGTQSHNIGAYPAKCFINRAVVSAEVFPTASTSCTIQLFKWDASASAEITLSAAVDVNAKTAKVGIAIPVSSSATDAQRLLDTNDTLYVKLVTTGTVSVQPDDFTVVVELLVLE